MSFNPSPDLKGIKTPANSGQMSRQSSFNPSPDLKGIKTKAPPRKVVAAGFNPSPDLKGIKTHLLQS